MATITYQEMYDRLVAAAEGGMFPSRKEDTKSCMYRGVNGKKCALGIFMRDKDYRKTFEYCGPSDNGFGRHIVKACDLPEGILTKHLCEIQSAHDKNSIVTDVWDTEKFIYAINKVACFSGVKKRESNYNTNG
jgi:hypothetical protein